jgi:ribonuclease HII
MLTKRSQKNWQKKLLQKRLKKSLKLSILEKSIFNNGFKRIIGIDEVGRGSMAGPMLITGFVLEPAQKLIRGIQDSKILNFNKRTTLSQKLSNFEHFHSLQEAIRIDNHGLTKCFLDGIAEILNSIADQSTYILVDGRLNAVQKQFKNSQCIVDGDALVYSIACASILAKVKRDQIYPDYGFDTHVGYCTKKHIEAVKNLGVLPIHRKIYKSVSQFDQQTLL